MPQTTRTAESTAGVSRRANGQFGTQRSAVHMTPGPGRYTGPPRTGTLGVPGEKPSGIQDAHDWHLEQISNRLSSFDHENGPEWVKNRLRRRRRERAESLLRGEQGRDGQGHPVGGAQYSGVAPERTEFP